MFNKNDLIVSEIIYGIVEDLGVEIFADAEKVSAVVSDYLADSSLTEEKSLFKRVISTGALSFVATTNENDYAVDRQKALHRLTDKELIDAVRAERVLVWLDMALGYTELTDEVMEVIREVSKETAANDYTPAEFLSPIDMILDPDNNENIVLYSENNSCIEFEQIAIVPLGDKVYPLLRPVTYLEGIAEDEALVFVIDEIDDEDCLMIVEDDNIVEEVFEHYYEMLREEGIDVD